MEQKAYHIPVLYKEVLDYLVTNRSGTYLDCTLGGGGHAEGILRRLSSDGRLIAIDQDDRALAVARERLSPFGERVTIFKNNFENLDVVLYGAGCDALDGILLDIGVSSGQLDEGDRGFSYKEDVPLDMRMDMENPQTAADIVNHYKEEDLTRILFDYGEEAHARKIARYIVSGRQEKKIETTTDLVTLIKKACPGKTRKHPARKTFQALRIEVNRELEVLEKALRKGLAFLKPGGRLAVISFHSLEDRIVKNCFKEFATGCTCPPELPVCVCGKKPTARILTKKPLLPSEEELSENYRAHSAKLRVVEKL